MGAWPLTRLVRIDAQRGANVKAYVPAAMNIRGSPGTSPDHGHLVGSDREGASPRAEDSEVAEEGKYPDRQLQIPQHRLVADLGATRHVV